MQGEQVSVSVQLQETDGMALEANLPTGHTIMLDAGEDHGGQNLGARPMHVLLVALAGCTAMDVVSFLRKMRQPVEGLEVRVEGVRRDEDPKVYTSIKVTYVVTGDVKEDRLERAVELSVDTYCSAMAMLRTTADIEIAQEIIRP